MQFFIKDSFSKYDQIHRKLRNMVTFIEKILNEKIHFLCSINVRLGASNTTIIMFKLLATFGALEIWDEFGLS